MYTEEMVKSVSTFAIKGSNQLKIGDRSYLQALADDPGRHQYFRHFIFNGQINSRPNAFALLRISEVVKLCQPHKKWYRVEVIQADSPDVLLEYYNGHYFPQTVKEVLNLTGRFHKGVIDIATHFNQISYTFDGTENYGSLVLCKDRYGMILSLDFDAAQIDLNCLQNDMLSLFQQDTTNTSILLLQQLYLRQNNLSRRQ